MIPRIAPRPTAFLRPNRRDYCTGWGATRHFLGIPAAHPYVAAEAMRLAISMRLRVIDDVVRVVQGIATRLAQVGGRSSTMTGPVISSLGATSSGHSKRSTRRARLPEVSALGERRERGAICGEVDWISLHETHFSNRIRPIGADFERAKTCRGRPISWRRTR